MRTRRLKIQSGEGYYHCISRTVAGAFLLGDEDKEQFRLLLHRVAGFCGVEVLAFAVMSNHFHILVRVPDPESGEARPDDGELARRLLQLYPRRRGWVEEQARMLRAGGEAAGWLRKALWARMGDVSAFMKELKQLYTRGYNARHGRFGTLWAERFKSVLVDGDPRVLRMMAAYIDLNPVRAGLCDDPADYRFCSYAEAVAGFGAARSGLAKLFGGEGWVDVKDRYRRYLFARGHRAVAGARTYSRAEVERVMAEGGKLEMADLLRRRLRYLVEGRILGRQAFVREQLEPAERILGRRRRVRPRQVLGEVASRVRTDVGIEVRVVDLRRERQLPGRKGRGPPAGQGTGDGGEPDGLAVLSLGRRAAAGVAAAGR